MMAKGSRTLGDDVCWADLIPCHRTVLLQVAIQSSTLYIYIVPPPQDLLQNSLVFAVLSAMFGALGERSKQRRSFQ